MTTPLRAPALYPLLLALAACGGGGDSPGEAEGAGASSNAEIPRYNREYVFVAPGAESPLVVPFSFQATDTGAELQRTVRGWLARGGTWDRFVEERQQTSRAGGVWRVLPDGDLTVLAGGPTEVEGLRFERGDRRLALDIGAPMSAWNQGGDTRFRVLRGRLTVGSEAVSGPVLELLRVDRTQGDGWPAPQEFDAIFLTSGDSLQLVMAEALSGPDADQGYSWLRRGDTDRIWNEGEVRWLEVTPYQDARRDIPRRWSFRIPGESVQGEVTSVGFDALLGPERGARRAVEVRYTVAGWISIDGIRRDVQGMVRHTQQ